MTLHHKTFTVRLVDGTTVGPIQLAEVKELLLRGEICEEDRDVLVKDLFAPLESVLPSHTLDGEQPGKPATFNSVDILAGIPPALVFIASEDGKTPDSVPPNAAEMGQLEHVSVPRLLYYFHTRQRSGRLQLLIDGQRPWEIFFARGTVEQVLVPPEQDDLSQRLLDQGLCSRDQIREAALKCQREGGQLSDHLIMLQYVNPHDLVRVLNKQFCDQLKASFAFQEGRYLFFSNDKPKTATIPYNIDLLPLILDGIQEIYDDHMIRWILEPFYNASISKVENPDVPIDRLRLSPRQTRLFHMIDQCEKLWDLIERANKLNISDEIAAHHFIYFLSQLELLLFDNHTLGPRIQDNVNLLQQQNEG